MQIWLHQLDGSSQTVNVNEPQEVLELTPNALARLVTQGSHLTSENASTLLFEGANVYVVGGLEGGKRKRKKKVYTTKKKNKHIHKKMKMAIYTLYSVDGTNLFIQAKEMSLSSAKLVPHVDQEPLWVSTGIAITVDSAILQSRWTPKLLRRTKKS